LGREEEPVRKKGTLLQDLPAAPRRKVNPIVRIGVAVVVIAGLIGGGLLLASQSSQSPDEKATALTAVVARDVLTVVSGSDGDGLAGVRVQAAVNEFNKNSGCKFIGGTVVTGTTSEEATARASKFILNVRQTPGGAQLGENLGLGFTVVPTGGLIRGVPYIAVLAAVDCTSVQPAGPTGLGS